MGKAVEPGLNLYSMMECANYSRAVTEVKVLLSSLRTIMPIPVSTAPEVSLPEFQEARKIVSSFAYHTPLSRCFL